MRKILIHLLFLVLPIVVGAQSKTITINWGDSSARESNNYQPNSGANSGAVEEDVLELDLDYGAPNYTTQWVDSNFADKNSVRVSNVKYGPLSTAELNRINKELVTNKLSYSIATTKARDILYTIFSISPIIRVNGSYQKVMSFSVDYNYGAQRRNAPPSRTNSVLASGKWFKFKVEKSGIHKIDKSFLKSLGMNTDEINPRNLKIYGNGGQTLPLLNSRNTIFDLPENSIQVIGEEDGRFDSNDYILFYGTSTEGYVLDNDSNLNPYADESFYYVTVVGGPGKRVIDMVEPSGSADHVISRFDDYQFHEKDEESPTKMGRTWYGNRFDINREQHYEFSFPNIISEEPIRMKLKVAAASESATSMTVSANGTSLDPINFTALSRYVLLSTKESVNNILASGETVKVDLVYNNSGNPSSVGYLDYLSVEAVRQLKGVSGQLPFRYKNAGTLTGIGEYQISNAAQFSQVWDVTDPYFITAKQNVENGTSISFKQNMGTVREYVAVNPNDYYTPVKIRNSVVANQDLKGSIFRDESGNFKDVDYIIITAPFLIQPALRLASFHRSLQGLNVKVVTTDKIYEEFSSGKQDIAAIRNFIRYVYYNASDPSKRIKYIGIMGDTSVDYKNRLPNNNNIVPTFHRVDGTSETASYMSDDFYGSMDDLGGSIGGNSYNENGVRVDDTDKLDIAMGRMIVDNVSLANAMVDKIIHYASKASYGNWRTNFVLVSDDVDKPSEKSLQKSLDGLGDLISEKKPFINVKKIHTDSYQQQTSAGGNRYPDVNEAIKNAVDVGSIVMNYFGHGGEDGLAHEAIYTKEMAMDFKNMDNLPCFVTVTCEFTKFDNPLRITAGELTYQNKEGGAISLVTTTRAVFINVGIRFNEKLARPMFGFDMEVPEVPAEALRIAKNEMTDINRRVIFFIGDPAMPLAFPKKDIRITKLNGQPVSQSTDVLKALSKVKFEGEVLNEAGQVMTDYNGVLETKVYDKNIMRQTLGNDGSRNDPPPNGDGQLIIMDFITLGESLFNGKASVKNGRFNFEFVVPRDIQIPVGKGRVSLYAKRDNQLEDQTGVNLDIDVGGLNENAPVDNEGPTIRLFMNDESFISGGITNDSPIFIAKLEDENGINTTSGIGHDIIAILDGDESNPFVLNEFYQTNVDDFTKGSTQYNFRDLEDGLHTIKLKAWDVYNNSSTAEIQFIVAGDDKLEITRVLNYPNPFVNYTEFWFNHNRPFEPLDVQVQVFTVAGKIVWTKNQTINTDGFLSRDIVWDGRDDFGDRIGKGVYVYKITVKSTLTNQRVEKFEKLVIL
ncbi:type IX secretion system sortase PorU [Aequorivita sp. H23M31]|uniref:Type IX secretion system sortase PorU n=1 Tax=Aequorivita ciconiae TaxID=2494375 RepID=A0A410G392_9FLAO|nr:type IX secretion system sortase PorU [Aequorivita sp. H23M31]QAA81744.1 type IX secretion system sortase PorU [Aequorivita sp. H23M31]